MSAGPEGFWLIYDGDCPVCRSVAHAIAIREKYGALNLVDARRAPDHLVCQRARAEGLDLDEGMVIFADGGVYHGAAAVSFLATFGEPTSLLTRVGKLLNYSTGISTLTYAMLRAFRNILLRLRGIGRIDNLRQSDPR